MVSILRVAHSIMKQLRAMIKRVLRKLNNSDRTVSLRIPLSLKMMVNLIIKGIQSEKLILHMGNFKAMPVALIIRKIQVCSSLFLQIYRRRSPCFTKRMIACGRSILVSVGRQN